jgi:hypothetical protein
MRGLSQSAALWCLQPPLVPHSWGKKRKYLGTPQTPAASCCTVMACYAPGIPQNPGIRLRRHRTLFCHPRGGGNPGKKPDGLLQGRPFNSVRSPSVGGIERWNEGHRRTLGKGVSPLCTSLWNWQKECLLRSRKRDAHTGVQEETSCRGPWSFVAARQCAPTQSPWGASRGAKPLCGYYDPPRLGDHRGLEEDSLEVLRIGRVARTKRSARFLKQAAQTDPNHRCPALLSLSSLCA